MTKVSTRIARLDELRFSAVLSDLDGVVYRGNDAIAGAVLQFNRWYRQGMPYAFVTNNAERSATEVAAKLQKMGIDCAPWQVVTSGEVALDYALSRFGPGAKAFVIGPDGLKARVEAAGFAQVGQGADFVLVGLDRGFDYQMMAQALGNLLNGAVLIGTNPDVIRPISDGFEPGTGAIIASIAAAAGVTPIILGKPDPTIINTALSRLGIPAADAIMLGDQLDTDILAAARAGVRSVFMETGVPMRKDSQLRADFLLAQLS